MKWTWTSFVMHPQCRKTQKQVEACFREAFGKDLKDVTLVSCGDMPEDTYIFIKCRNYHDHIGGLIRAGVILTALPSTANPDFLSESDVNEFIQSMAAPVAKSGDFAKGDLVMVRDGYLTNLVGIILAEEKLQYKVCFRLHTRHFTEKLKAAELEYKGHVIGQISKYVADMAT